MSKIKAVIFDWGDTIMRDYRMYNWRMDFWPRVELMPGAHSALKDLPPGVICCLATNAAHSDAYLVARAFNRVAVRQYFDHIFTSLDLGVEKPNPEFFRKILRRLRLRADQCVMIGDSYRKDIVPAKTLGMRTIWFCRKEPCGDAPKADLVIHSMSEAAEAVRRLMDAES